MTKQNIDREQTLALMTNEPLDVLIVGGGIVGAGIARDAAMRGLRTGLLEQADFSSGTSSRSSRLLHGGIRYLAQGRVPLVWEASREKTVLRKIAPHLAEPLPFLFPTRHGTPWTYWKLSAGVKLYDLLCGLKNYGKSSSLSIARIRELLPGLSTKNLTGGVRYFDALTNDARLVIDTLKSAATNGAMLLNYTEFVSSARSGELWNCRLKDIQASSELEITARTVVNAAGPWSDRLPHSRTQLRLTKGVHLVVDRERFPIPEAVVMADGDRIMFAIPWGQRVILGTTDTDYDGDIANPMCDARDVAEVLGVVNGAFPDANLTADDIISTWAGLRPLVADLHGKPSDISRRHKIEMSEPGWWDVTGGKLTTYRLMGEETVDQLVSFLKFEAKPCRTADVSLIDSTQSDGISGVLPPTIEREVVANACKAEWARHLDDVMIRRTSWRYYHREQLAIANQVADWMAGELGWSDEQRQAEWERYERITERASI
jgi:glycerol-3-phosphate dehydrogenase